DDPRVVGENTAPGGAEKNESTQVKFGISIRPPSDDEKELTPDKRGVAVSRVEQNSFAGDIGMMERDIIVAINRQQINSVDDIRRIQQGLKAGDAVAFRVVRPLVLGRGRTANGPKSTTLFLSGTLPN